MGPSNGESYRSSLGFGKSKTLVGGACPAGCRRRGGLRSEPTYPPHYVSSGEVTQRLEAVVFDVGGVLLDWDPEYLYRRLIPDAEERRRFLTEVCTPEWNLAQDAGRPWSEAVAELTERFPEQAELIAAYDERWEETVAGSMDETVGVLEDLRRAGTPVFALTNFSSEKWEVAVDRWPFLGTFEGRVVSGHEGVTKPDPRLYRILLDRFGLVPERTFYVDDRPENVEQARRLGIRAELFIDARTLRSQLSSRGLLDGGA